MKSVRAAGRRTIDASDAYSFLYRYPPEATDGFAGWQGAFVPMPFWAVTAQALTGDLPRALGVVPRRDGPLAVCPGRGAAAATMGTVRAVNLANRAVPEPAAARLTRRRPSGGLGACRNRRPPGCRCWGVGSRAGLPTPAAATAVSRVGRLHRLLPQSVDAGRHATDPGGGGTQTSCAGWKPRQDRDATAAAGFRHPAIGVAGIHTVLIVCRMRVRGHAAVARGLCLGNRPLVAQRYYQSGENTL